MKEPLIHSHITDCLPEEDSRAFTNIFCSQCDDLLHAANNECMQTWIDFHNRQFCTKCYQFTEVLA